MNPKHLTQLCSWCSPGGDHRLSRHLSPPLCAPSCVESHEPEDVSCNVSTTNRHLSSLPAQDRRRGWGSVSQTHEVAASEKPRDAHARDAGEEEAWRPAVRPAEVTVTDVTLNSLTVTFRESQMATGFFRDWALKT